MKVSEMMSSPVLVVAETATLEEVAQFMLDQRIGCVPVVNRQGQLSGIITESSFAAQEKGVPFSTFRAPQVLGQWLSGTDVERIYEAARRVTAREIIQTSVITVTEGQSLNEAVELMLRHDINRLPVVRDDVPVGLIARHDLLKMLAGSSHSERPS